jgi:hypothetical protein
MTQQLSTWELKIEELRALARTQKAIKAQTQNRARVVLEIYICGEWRAFDVEQLQMQFEQEG